MIASFKGFIDAVNFLLTNSANTELTHSNTYAGVSGITGRTAIMYAAMSPFSRNADIITALASNGANVDAVDSLGIFYFVEFSFFRNDFCFVCCI